MDVVYSLRRHPYAEGRTYQNPRHFIGPVEGAKHVFIEGDFPKVASAYKRAGVTVTELGPVGPVEQAKAGRGKADKAARIEGDASGKALPPIQEGERVSEA